MRMMVMVMMMAMYIYLYGADDECTHFQLTLESLKSKSKASLSNIKWISNHQHTANTFQNLIN